MKVLKSKRSGNTIALEVEATHQEIESKMDGAFKRVRKKASVPGFRKGTGTSGELFPFVPDLFRRSKRTLNADKCGATLS